MDRRGGGRNALVCRHVRHYCHLCQGMRKQIICLNFACFSALPVLYVIVECANLSAASDGRRLETPFHTIKPSAHERAWSGNTSDRVATSCECPFPISVGSLCSIYSLSKLPLFPSRHDTAIHQVGECHHARTLRRRHPSDRDRVGEELPGQPSYTPNRLPSDLWIRAAFKQQGS